MVDEKKFLDQNGVEYLWSQLSLKDYPNNETLVAVINAIDETKADRSELANMLQAVYPIGSIYITTSAVSPSVLFGFGEWEQIKDTFLLSAGDTYEVGSTGGEEKHTLTYKELPKINGSIVMHNASYGTNIAGVSGCFTSATTNQGTYRNGGSQLEADTVSVGKINYSNGGSGTAHNNMPPYLVVYIWKRTA